jgi:hypothetical protein
LDGGRPVFAFNDIYQILDSKKNALGLNQRLEQLLLLLRTISDLFNIDNHFARHSNKVTSDAAPLIPSIFC